MAKTVRLFRNVRPALSLWTSPEPVAPPSAEVVAAVLALGDVRAECEDGRVSIRFSALRVEDAEVALLLGGERNRALDVTVIWDEAEAEIVRVLDVAPLRAAAAADAGNRYLDARMRGLARAAPTPRRAAA